MNFVNAGIPVTLLEINDVALQRGKDIIAKNYAMTVKKGKLTAELALQRQELITGTTDYNDLVDMDLVIEMLSSLLKPGGTLYIVGQGPYQMDEYVTGTAGEVYHEALNLLDAVKSVSAKEQHEIREMLGEFLFHEPVI